MNPISEALGRLRLAAQIFWQARSAQERKLLAVGAGVLGLALFYSVLIAPAVSGRAQLQKDLPQLRQEAAEIAALARQAGELANQAPTQVAPLGREALNASLAARGLAPQSLALTGEYIRVQFSGAPFASLLTWLDALRRESRVVVQEANIVAQAGPGLVDANLTLRQEAGAAR